MTYSETFLKRIETSNTKRQTTPDYRLKNPIDADIFLTGIVIVADEYFQFKGKCVVLINDTPIFDESEAVAFKDVNAIPISLKDKKLSRSSKIDIFVWNSVDNDIVSLTVNLKLSENQDDVFIPAIPIDKQSQRDSISTPIILFPLQIYQQSQSPYTKLLDTKGYKNFAFTMASSTIPSIDELENQDAGSKSVDITYNGGGGSTNPANDSYSDSSDYDLKSSGNKNIQLTIGANNDTQIDARSLNIDDGSHNGYNQYNAVTKYHRVVTYTVIESDAPDFSNPTTIYNNVANLVLPIPTTKRYLRITQNLAITFVITVTQYGHQNGAFTGCQGCGPNTVAYSAVPLTLSAFYNQDTQGGQASMSLELLGAGNQWYEIVSAAELGTVTSGQQVIKQVGDAISRSTVDKVGFLIASTQTKLRAKLTVVNNIETAVELMMV